MRRSRHPVEPGPSGSSAGTRRGVAMPTELTASSVRAVRLPLAAHGYDTATVDDFIDWVAAGAEILHRRIAGATERAVAAESRAAELASRAAELDRVGTVSAPAVSGAAPPPSDGARPPVSMVPPPGAERITLEDRRRALADEIVGLERVAAETRRLTDEAHGELRHYLRELVELVEALAEAGRLHPVAPDETAVPAVPEQAPPAGAPPSGGSSG